MIGHSTASRSSSFLTQFPHRERKQQYQSYWIGDEYEKGSRDINYRLDMFNIPFDLSKMIGVVDLGCQLGSIAQACYKRGARKVTGIDYEKDYIECARDLARYNQHEINFQNIDLRNTDKIIDYLNDYYKEPIDMLFMLALDKHVGFDNLLKIIDNVKFKSLFWEGNAAQDVNTGHVIETDVELNKRFGGNAKRIGFTTDRNMRFIWRVDL